ncbi:hypothetical protein A6R68_07702, partial [Neotoma lepida]
YHLVGTQKLQCIDGEWNSSYPTCESIQEAPRPAEQIALEKAIVKQMWAKHPQAMRPTRAPHGRLHRNRDAVAWPFSRLWRVSDQTLFKMTFIAALWVAVFGKCGPPPDIPGAMLVSEMNQTDFESRTILKYSCLPGYSRATSSQTISCNPDGKWHINTVCVKKSCRNPGDLRNGQVEVKTDFSFGSQIKFSCLEGYVLVGSPTSYCEIQSRGVVWSNPLPQCVIVKCGSPPDISNGRHNGGYEDFYTYGSSVTYRCDPSFSLLGNASITCTVANKTVGVWSSSPPTCERFILRGSSLIRCEADGNWSPSPPICELS